MSEIIILDRRNTIIGDLPMFFLLLSLIGLLILYIINFTRFFNDYDFAFKSFIMLIDLIAIYFIYFISSFILKNRGKKWVYFIDLNKNIIGINDQSYDLNSICYFFQKKYLNEDFFLLLDNGDSVPFDGSRVNKYLDFLLEKTNIPLIIAEDISSSKTDILYNWNSLYKNYCNQKKSGFKK